MHGGMVIGWLEMIVSDQLTCDCDFLAGRDVALSDELGAYVLVTVVPECTVRVSYTLLLITNGEWHTWVCSYG